MEVYIINDDFTIDVIEDLEEYRDNEQLNRIHTENALIIGEDSIKEEESQILSHLEDNSIKAVEEIKTEKREMTNEEKHSKAVRYHKCNLCGYYTQNSRSYWFHIRAHTDGRSRLFRCRYCDYGAFHKFTLSFHLSQCMPEHKRVKCPQCNFVTAKHKNLKAHIQNVHENKRKRSKHSPIFRCENCNFMTKKKEEFKEHKEKIHKSRIKCKKCGLEVFTRTEMMQHRKVHKKEVNKIKIYKCDLCVYESKRHSDVRVHRTRKHVQELLESQ